MSSSPAQPATPSGVGHPNVAEASSISIARAVPRVGKYRVLAELGRGGMANVYLAVVHGPGGVNKLVVLKALLPELASEPQALSMFLDEARLAAQLNHPNVVQTYEIGTEGDRHVIVMEYLEGQSLWAILRRGVQVGDPLATPLHLRILIGALEGLHYAHELRSYNDVPLDLVHRDISPQNIFVTYDGQVKVLDFGIAKAASSSTHTATGVVKGKIAYMAPEQTIADSVDRRADVYSVGCLLWAVATGRKLWKDTADVQIMRRVINGEIPTPQSVNPDCDDELNRIVMKALQHDRAQRYQTALEFQQDLEAYCELQPQPKQKVLARYVSTLFAETRAELKALIDSRLASAEREASSPGDAITSLAIPPVTRSESHGASLASTVVQSNTSRRRGALWIALAAVPLLIVGAMKLGARTPAEDAERLSKPAPTLAGATAAAAPNAAAVRFHVRPAGAKLFLDDQELPPNLASKVLPLDGQKHSLRAEADGYTSGVTEFFVGSDTSAELELKPQSASEPTSASSGKKGSKATGRVIAPTHGAAVAAVAAAPAPPAAAVDNKHCEEPFFYTPDGIRKLRPECM